eukprot:Rmarinus@m.22845
MIRNVIFFSSSGMVLFSKQFISAVSQPRMTGSLLAALLEFSTMNVGMPVSYIELATVCVTIVMNEGKTIICALFHDVDDGAEFGRVIASQLLLRFTEFFPREMLTSVSINAANFYSFNSRISQAIRSCIRPILSKLERVKGVKLAALVTSDQQTHSCQPLDRLAIVANLQFLLNSATDVLSVKKDLPLTLVIEGPRTRVLIARLRHATLLTVAKKSLSASKCKAGVQRAWLMLNKVFSLLESIHELNYLR